jgi:hypothetical protein
MGKIIFASALLTIANIFFTITSNAEVRKIDGKDGDGDVIIVNEEISRETEKKFRSIALETENALVVLESPGGSVRSAIEIGKIIRIKNFSTAVLNSKCVSACALVWLAGSARMSLPSSGIGFHAAYTEGDDGRKIPTSVGNALVGAYLNSLGLNETIVEYVTTASPTEIKWLSKAKAESLGLPVRILDNKNGARANFNLAIQKRWGPTPSISEALRLYRESAADGFAGAQNNLGDLYENGIGVKKDEKFSIYWYTRAAERGEPTAYLSLATLLIEDTEDESILVEAFKFSILAYRHLPEGTNKKIAESAARHISARLTPDLRKKSRELADNWQPLYQERYLMSDTPSNKIPDLR